jgi:SAM-dependent methyltransferase
MSEQLYEESFFSNIREGAQRSASHIVPLVMTLVRPTSVIDVGCGTGSFLSVFKKNGVREVFGVDGQWAKPELAPGEFQPADLSKPLSLGRRFDLVVSLEVAEHLDPSSADAFVRSLVSLGPVVLFSAAIPYQGGTGHVNEQWPDYWATRFAREGYEQIDCLRSQLWTNREVEWWYAQNTFLYVERAQLASMQSAHPELRAPSGLPLRMPHPENYLHQVRLREQQYWSSWSPRRIMDGLARRLTRQAAGKQ